MKYYFLLILTSLLLFSCSNDDDENAPAKSANFTVTIENILAPKPIFESGTFTTPVGVFDSGPIFPGDAYEFTIDAGPVVIPGDGGTRLSFITMFMQSNDLFFAPDIQGISLYTETGSPIGAHGPEDVTNEVYLWDAGTEINEATGGQNQKLQQGPLVEDQGVDEYGVVTRIDTNKDSFGNVLPNKEDVIKVTIENISAAKFLVRIENVSEVNTIMTPGQGEGSAAAVPISPGVYAVHTSSSPFFDESMAASGAGFVRSEEGLENLAEDGFPETLLANTKNVTGLKVPFSSGVWAIHNEGSEPLFNLTMEDYGEGLEGLAEDGSPIKLANSLNDRAEVSNAEVFNTPVGTNVSGPITPDSRYEFTFTASEGDHLSFATMFMQSNDWFFAFPPNGLALFKNGTPTQGNVTSHVFLYDAGTEADEYPGAGLSQVMRQPRENFGALDTNTAIRLVAPNSFLNIPVTTVLKVTIKAEKQ